jgi:hypothetical protein
VQSFFEKKQQIQEFMGKTIFFSGTLSFSPWAVSATRLNLGAPQKLQEN